MTRAATDARPRVRAAELFGALPEEEFLAEYKNPCWHPTNVTDGKTLLCLPFYFILGDFQCGVRDLAHRILMARRAARGCTRCNCAPGG